MEKASHLGQVRAAGVFTSRYAVLGIATASIPAAPRSNHVAVSQIHSRLGKVRSTPIATAETAKGTSSNAVDIEVRRRRSIMGAVDFGWADYSRVRWGWRRKPKGLGFERVASAIDWARRAFDCDGKAIDWVRTEFDCAWKANDWGWRALEWALRAIDWGWRAFERVARACPMFCLARLSMRTLPIRARTNPAEV